LEFLKMHGSMNDFVFLDEFKSPLGLNYEETARTLCHRQTGIGADGLIIVLPTPQADAQMRIFNADGSEAEMCGNGIRCFAKFVYETGYVRKSTLTIETAAGIKQVWLSVQDGLVSEVRVDMGAPVLEAAKIPVRAGQEPVIKEKIEVDGETYYFTAVSMGNPHCVIFVADADGVDLQKVGPRLEKHELFPSYTNVEFAQVLKRNEIKIRVWERGVGVTLACGTGACAALVAGVLEGRLDRDALVHLPGGDLRIVWQDSGAVLMTGPAQSVFSGTMINLQ
jgi:diaminopimelate epimerase